MYLLGVSSSSVSSGYNMIIKIFPEYLILVVKMLCCNYFSLTWWINPLPTCISKAKQFVFIPEVIPLSACLITLPRLIHSCTFFFSTSRTSRRPLASSNFFIDPVQHEIKILIPFGHLPSTTIIGVQYDFISANLWVRALWRGVLFMLWYILGVWVGELEAEFSSGQFYISFWSTLTFLKIHLLISVAWGDAAFIICC